MFISYKNHHFRYRHHHHSLPLIHQSLFILLFCLEWFSIHTLIMPIEYEALHKIQPQSENQQFLLLRLHWLSVSEQIFIFSFPHVLPPPLHQYTYNIWLFLRSAPLPLRHTRPSARNHIGMAFVLSKLAYNPSWSFSTLFLFNIKTRYTYENTSRFQSNPHWLVLSLYQMAQLKHAYRLHLQSRTRFGWSIQNIPFTASWRILDRRHFSTESTPAITHTVRQWRRNIKIGWIFERLRRFAEHFNVWTSEDPGEQRVEHLRH